MLTDLFNNIIKSIHDLINHPSASTAIKDIAITAEYVANVIPEIEGNKSALVSDIVNSALTVASQNLPK